MDMVFNESAMYNDRLDDKTKEPKMIELDEISDSDVLKPQDTNIRTRWHQAIQGSSMDEILHLKEFSEEFAMKNLGAAKQILGMRISRDEE
ncbi:hypothetical protein CsSME_00037607 [Camellia sinensis var. sinensis]